MSDLNDGAYVATWDFQGRTITFRWVGDIEVPVTRVYALALTDEGKVLLVGDGQGDEKYWLPGGGLEDGETPEAALRRELREEAAAQVLRLERLGVQQSEYQGRIEHQAFYWCRIKVSATFVPETEVTERRLVSPEAFLDHLFWGRSDPKAAMLLTRAMHLNATHAQE